MVPCTNQAKHMLLLPCSENNISVNKFLNKINTSTEESSELQNEHVMTCMMKDNQHSL
jgi:hypothetical protein